MPTIDVAMPTALLIVILVAMFLNKRVERKLMQTVEQKAFKPRDIIMLGAFIAILVSVIAYTAVINPGGIFQNVLLVLFLTSYTTLLFTFSYVLAKLSRLRAQILSVSFGVASLIAAVASFLGPLADALTIYRGVAFAALAVFCFGGAVYEQLRAVTKHRWYIAAQPPALFLLLFVFFRIIYDGAVMVWFPLLLDLFGLTFAVLIILYLSSMFSWKTVGIFAVLLTVLDMILVFSGPMTAAADTFTGLGLPVLVYLPNIPLFPALPGYLDFFGFGIRGLGLGDFFFAGILAIQTYKKYGAKTAIVAAVTMVVAFGIWEAYLHEITGFLSPIFYPIAGKALNGFPGTLMIISGWAPIVAYKMLRQRNKASKTPTATSVPVAETPKDGNSH